IGTTGDYGRFTNLQIFDPLVQNYPDGQPNTEGRAVAESYEVSEDGLTYTFEIKEGIQFHNGEELTAEDVAFTFHAIMGKAEEKHGVTGVPESVMKMHTTEISSVEATDDYTLEIQMDEVYAELLEGEFVQDFSVIPKDYIVENGYENYQDELIGSGPFKFKEYSPGDQIVLEKFEDYRLDVNAEKLILHFYDDQSSAVTDLRAGNIHAVHPIDTTHYQDLKGEENIKSKAYHHPGAVNIKFNHKMEGPLQDVKVRKAFAYAVDSQEVIDFKRKELAINSRYLYEPGHPAYPENANQYEQNITKAKELLDEAGYPDGVELTIHTNPGDRTDEMTLVSEQVAEAGIDLEVQSVEWGTFVEMMQAGETEMNYHHLTAGPSGFDKMTYYMNTSEKNFWGNFYNDSQFNDMMEDAMKTIDYEDRMEKYKEIQKYLIEDNMAVYVVGFTQQPIVYHESVTIPEEAFTSYMYDGPYYKTHLWEL
ncbi:MAG: ABC transporter substrate-binding protein, partial [Candidatus Thermoplasmatota archaeon]|nr:ABC transporter substrate-binding protein [Candidatus Thermoplasmatota archaeon]